MNFMKQHNISNSILNMQLYTHILLLSKIFVVSFASSSCTNNQQLKNVTLVTTVVLKAA